MSCHAMPCHHVSTQIMSCQFKLLPQQFMSCHATSCPHLRSCHVSPRDHVTTCMKLSCWICTVEVDALKVRSALDVVKQELTKLTGAKKHTMVVGQIEPSASDSLQRFKRGRKAFGSRVESRFVATSVQGIANAKCGAMTYLKGDTFFNRWPVKLIPVSDLKQLEEQAYEKMWESVPWVAFKEDFPYFLWLTLLQQAHAGRYG